MLVIWNTLADIRNEVRTAANRMGRIWNEAETVLDKNTLDQSICRAALVAAIRESTTVLDDLKAGMERELKQLGEEAAS